MTIPGSGKGIKINVFPAGKKGDSASKKQHPFRSGGDPGVVPRFSNRLYRRSPPGIQNPDNRDIGSNRPLSFFPAGFDRDFSDNGRGDQRGPGTKTRNLRLSGNPAGFQKNEMDRENWRVSLSFPFSGRFPLLYHGSYLDMELSNS